MNDKVALSLLMPREIWVRLRRVAEVERTPSGRASIGGIVNRILAEALRDPDEDPPPRRESR